jgi:nicotinate-nucleotide pyrophosphorylase (carboxylating)
MERTDIAIMPLQPFLYQEIVRRTLLEDLGRAGDLTTDAIVHPEEEAVASVIARTEGRIAGLNITICAFRCLDERIHAQVLLADGNDAHAGDQLAVVRGSARAILSAERTALNFLGHLCGIATATRGIVAAVAPFHARVVCTRKTTPGLRLLEKYAVRAGGGANHRFGLDDAVLIKDNHRAIAGGITEAIRRVRRHAGHMVKIEVEVDTLHELEEALRQGVDAVLLDNMPV